MDTLKLLNSLKADGVKVDSNCLRGDYKTLCELIGYEAVEKIYIYFRGSGYIKLSKKLFDDSFVHKYIVTRYHNGHAAEDLAREYDYTYSHVMKLIRRAKSRHISS